MRVHVCVVHRPPAMLSIVVWALEPVGSCRRDSVAASSLSDDLAVLLATKEVISAASLAAVLVVPVQAHGEGLGCAGWGLRFRRFGSVTLELRGLDLRVRGLG